MPTTPWCQFGSNKATPAGRSSSLIESTWRCSSACCRISRSIVRRSKFNWCNRSARVAQRDWSSLSKHSMPSVISARRPAAFSLGPKANPKSVELILRCSIPATFINALMPGTVLPARIRRKPCSARIRLFLSSGTTSAMVPSATRSSNSPSFGSAKSFSANQSRRRNSSRSPSNT